MKARSGFLYQTVNPGCTARMKIDGRLFETNLQKYNCTVEISRELSGLELKEVL